MRYDAIVIGAGHNGLVTAAYLARAGWYVLMLERREITGGTMSTEEVYPGFHYDSWLSHLGWIHPKIDQDLGLSRHGLQVLAGAPALNAVLPDRDALLLRTDNGTASGTLQRFSAHDARRWPAYCQHVSRLNGFLAALYATTPPALPDVEAGEILGLLGLGPSLLRLGREGIIELLRTLPMSVVEFLDEWFENPALKGALGAAGITGIFQGPYAAGTALVMLHHGMPNPGLGYPAPRFVQGGTGQLAQALTEAAKRYGAAIRTAAPVAQVRVREGRANGVVLEDGDEIEARYVISNADPRRTFLELVDPGHLTPAFVRQVRNIKYRGCAAKVNLALERLPDFPDPLGDGTGLRGLLTISPSLDYLSRAHDDAKYGGVSRRPYLQVTIPSLADPTLAPPGKHVLSVLVQYAPYALKEGPWGAERREALGDAVVNTLAEYAPNLSDAILHRQVRTPADLEALYGLTEGDVYHGELTLDQILFMRPVAGWGQYRTPIGNLYLCGAGTHPGGGMIGAPGYNAAREVMRAAKRDRDGIV